jgi:hypothetical protein
MAGERRVALINGLWRDGLCHNAAVVRPLTGDDEMLLDEIAGGPAARATALLAATVVMIGALSPVGHEEVRGLTIGDRERLLLALHAASFGGDADSVVACGGCGETVELPLDLDAMLGAPIAPPSAPEHSLAVRNAPMRFRLPTGADQERAAAGVLADPQRAADALRRACILSVADGPAQLPAAIDDALEAAVRRLDPWCETMIAVECPNCGGSVRGTLDAMTLLDGRLGPAGAILADIDRLARAYHWSEAATLALPTARRRRYLALLDRVELAA